MNSVINGETIQPRYALESRAQGSATLVAPNDKNASWANTNGEDVVLIDAIIQQVEGDLCRHPSSRFATGSSPPGSSIAEQSSLVSKSLFVICICMAPNLAER
ncbi:hypothetical protein N7471_011728 [Penicillium samsonianum]|uniref:uncharacterized protein n=1 Tax=Penicillium samsonianum TaxID=1882272 RepID=UPI0025472984|nr:uncharacterized protein N7471_011728 [Penicillium samsonianum]KAJ6124411.1 hypothetical protein N7471_011728 [Penicillium samsonianum]